MMKDERVMMIATNPETVAMIIPTETLNEK